SGSLLCSFFGSVVLRVLFWWFFFWFSLVLLGLWLLLGFPFFAFFGFGYVSFARLVFWGLFSFYLLSFLVGRSFSCVVLSSIRGPHRPLSSFFLSFGSATFWGLFW